MLACERCTVTHSSGWAAGLAAMRAVSEAEAGAEAEVVADDGEADPDCDGDLLPDGDPLPDGEALPDGESAAEAEPAAGVELDGAGDSGIRLGLLVAVELLVGGEALGELEDSEGAGADVFGVLVGVLVGVGVGVGVLVGVLVGVGVGVLAAGSTWHLVSLADVAEVGEAAAARSEVAVGPSSLA